jgi:hypothetical protein
LRPVRTPHRESGQAAVETVLALPIVVVAMLLVAQAMLVVRDQLLLVHAAREAARAGAVSDGSVAGDAAAAGERATPLRPDRLVIATGVDGEWVVVDTTYASPTDLPLVGTLIGDVTLTAHTEMRREGIT